MNGFKRLNNERIEQSQRIRGVRHSGKGKSSLRVTWRFRRDVHAETYATNMTPVKKVLSLFQRRFYAPENQLRVRNTSDEFSHTLPRRFPRPFRPFRTAFSIPRFRHCLRRGNILQFVIFGQTSHHRLPAFSSLRPFLRLFRRSFRLPFFVLSAILPTTTMHI